MNFFNRIFLLLILSLTILGCHQKALPTDDKTLSIQDGIYQGKVNAKRIIYSINISGNEYEIRSAITDGITLNSSGEKGTIVYKKDQYFLVTDSVLVTKQNPTSKDLIMTIRSARMGGKPGNQVYKPIDEFRESIVDYCACGDEFLIRYNGKCFALFDKEDFINRGPNESHSSIVEKKCETWDDSLAK